MRDAKAAGVLVDWEQVDPLTGLQLWLAVQPGQDLDYIDSDRVSEQVDRFVAFLFDETSDLDSPGPLASRQWFESWLAALLKDADTQQWVIALGSYGYDWTTGGSSRGADQVSRSDEPGEQRRR